MVWEALPRSGRQIAFFVAHALVAVMLYWFWYMPTKDFFAERDMRIANQKSLLQRLESLAAREGEIEQLIAKVNTDLNQGEFLDGTNHGTIAADLQTKLKSIAEGSGARLMSAQSLAPGSTNGPRSVGVRIDLLGTHAAIQRTIHTIETAKPYLFVTTATLKQPAGNAALNPANEPQIEARLELVGQLKADRPPK